MSSKFRCDTSKNENGVKYPVNVCLPILEFPRRSSFGNLWPWVQQEWIYTSVQQLHKPARIHCEGSRLQYARQLLPSFRRPEWRIRCRRGIHVSPAHDLLFQLTKTQLVHSSNSFLFIRRVKQPPAAARARAAGHHHPGLMTPAHGWWPLIPPNADSIPYMHNCVKSSLDVAHLIVVSGSFLTRYDKKCIEDVYLYRENLGMYIQKKEGGFYTPSILLSTSIIIPCFFISSHRVITSGVAGYRILVLSANTYHTLFIFLAPLNSHNCTMPCYFHV